MWEEEEEALCRWGFARQLDKHKGLPSEQWAVGQRQSRIPFPTAEDKQDNQSVPGEGETFSIGLKARLLHADAQPYT